jgi:hypothetical protein
VKAENWNIEEDIDVVVVVVVMKMMIEEKKTIMMMVDDQILVKHQLSVIEIFDYCLCDW